jgi:hypothetical protein
MEEGEAISSAEKRKTSFSLTTNRDKEMCVWIEREKGELRRIVCKSFLYRSNCETLCRYSLSLSIPIYEMK